jgi:prevent-host-death family protein
VTEVTVREFSYNPSAIFARVEHGERIEVTRHGKVIAVVSMPERHGSRYDELVAQGLIRPAPGSWQNLPHVDVPDDVDPLEILAETREERDLVEMLGPEEKER